MNRIGGQEARRRQCPNRFWNSGNIVDAKLCRCGKYVALESVGKGRVENPQFDDVAQNGGESGTSARQVKAGHGTLVQIEAGVMPLAVGGESKAGGADVAGGGTAEPILDRQADGEVTACEALQIHFDVSDASGNIIADPLRVIVDGQSIVARGTDSQEMVPGSSGAAGRQHQIRSEVARMKPPLGICALEGVGLANRELSLCGLNGGEQGQHAISNRIERRNW